MTYAGDYGSFMRYVAIEVNLTISSIKGEYAEVNEVLRKWDEYLLNKTAGLSKPVQRAYQSTPKDRTWAWMHIQEVLVQQAIQGLVIAMIVYFVVITLYTNIFATITVPACPTTLVGVYTALNWNLGLLESVLLVLPIGMTVDFVTHFAVWYTLPDDPNVRRLERTAWAFSQGVYGVFGGAFMMFGASLFLLGSPLEFVFGFGVTLSFTLGMGLSLGMFLFLTLLGIAGPEDQDCNIMQCCAKTSDGKMQSSDLNSIGPGGRPNARVSLSHERPLSTKTSTVPPPPRIAEDSSDSDSDDDARPQQTIASPAGRGIPTGQRFGGAGRIGGGSIVPGAAPTSPAVLNTLKAPVNTSASPAKVTSHDPFAGN